MNSTIGKGGALAVGSITILIIMLGVWGMSTFVDKQRCQAELPRNVSCVWTAPGEVADE